MMDVGLDSIIKLYDPGNLNCLKERFSEAPGEAFIQAHREVDLLISPDNRCLLLKGGRDVDNFGLVYFLFRCGVIFTGATPAGPDPKKWD